ncbi:MAG: hypothetical protein R6U56_05400 [Opitutales bacterium]
MSADGGAIPSAYAEGYGGHAAPTTGSRRLQWFSVITKSERIRRASRT